MKKEDRALAYRSLQSLIGGPHSAKELKSGWRTRAFPKSPSLALAQAEIAYRRGSYDKARASVQTVTPIFIRQDAEPYQKRAFESLKAALDKPALRK
jgi:hypothetical protein